MPEGISPRSSKFTQKNAKNAFFPLILMSAAQTEER